MSSIDQRVVEAKFDNKQFQEGVRSTISSLDSLKKGLNLSGASQGLNNVAQATGRVSHGFSVMRIAAFTAISTITRQLVYMAEHVVAAFTIDPIKEGFQNYETQINAVQTILANTGLKGAKGLKQVNDVLAELNVYANKTVYNFSEMARNIGTFTAAGVKLKPAAESIKGIANLAAMSGSSSQQASTAMYQLSQAIAANQVKLQDWNSVVNAGIGGKVFQKALFDTAEQMGTIKHLKMNETFDQWTKSGHTFRQSLQEGWINAKVLTTTLQEFTGDMTKQQLKAIGYNAQQIKAIQEQGKTAVDAATKIKTFTQLSQALKEEVGTAYASIFKTLFGDINQAKSALSPLHQTLENFLTGPIYSLNKVLQDWAKLGGRTAAIDTFKAAWKDLGEVLKPIHDAFRQIFPATTGATLYKLTVTVRDFFQNFKMGAGTADELKRTFAGLFALLDIGWQIIRQVAHFLFDLFSTAGKGSGGILKVSASLGDFLVKLDDAVKKGHGLRDFFLRLENILKPVINFVRELVSHITHLGDKTGPAFGKVTSFLEHIGHILGPIATAVEHFFTNLFGNIDFSKILQAFNLALVGGIVVLIKRLVDRFKSKGDGGVFKDLIATIKEPFEELTTTLQQMQRTLQAATLMEIAIAVGVLTASAVALSRVDAGALGKALAAMGGMFAELLGATLVFSKIGGAKGLISTSAGLILFATALRVLTSAVVKLSDLSWAQLAKGLTGVAVLIGALTLAARGMSGQAGGMVRTGAALLILAEAIKVLASAVADISKLSWGEIAKGLTGVGALLVGLTLFTKFSDASKLGIARGAGLVLLAAGIKILASAVGDFGKMDWTQIAKGLVSIGAILAEFTIFSKTVGNPLSLVAASAALIGVGVAMNVLARALGIFGRMDWGEIGKGLVTMAGALGLVVLALNAMPITSVLSAAALVAVSTALIAIGGAMKIMGSMSWSSVAKGLIVLAGALTIIAVAMDVMITALPGAAALLVVAASLAILVPELALLGQLSWMSILKGLVALAGAFTVIGVAGALITPVIPSLLGLGAAIALLGVGVAAIGAGVMLFATGLTALATSGVAAAAALKAIFTTVVGFLPILAKALGQTLVELAKSIAVAAPALFHTAIVLIDQLLKAINQESPRILNSIIRLTEKMLTKLADATPKLGREAARLMVAIIDAIDTHTGKIIDHFTNMVIDIIHALQRNTGRFVTAAANWMLSIINGIDRNLGKIIDAGTRTVINFINGVQQSSNKIIDAGMKAIIAFMNGIATSIRQNTPAFQQAGRNIANAIADGLTGGLASKVGDVATSAENLAKGALHSAMHFLGAHSPSREFHKLGLWVDEGFANGIIGGKQTVIAAWTQTSDLLKTAMSNAAQDISTYSQKLKAAENAHDSKKIREFTAALAQAHSEYNRASNALDLLKKHRKDEEAHLERLGKRYDAYTARLDKANQKLQNAIQIQKDYKNSIQQQYDVLPDVQNTTTLQDYTQQTEQSIADLQTFIDTLAQLRKRGLSDMMYKELLSKGTAALPLAEEILAGGKDSISQVNQMGSQLAKEAKQLANTASTQLYQAGVDSAQGLVDGLKKKRRAIADQMRAIAHELVVELKRELKIHSPSQIFDELGQFTGSGLALGLRKSVPEVQKATSHLGKNTIETMKASIQAMNDMLKDQTDLQPTIRPVLDLSTVKKQAAGIHSALASKQLAIGGAYSAAANASAGYQANQSATAPAEAPPAPADVTFNQYNTSPKALSSADIYRQTRNQLSKAKGALSVTPVR